MSDEEIHQRRKKNNLMLGLVLVGFVVLVFSITVIKMTNSGPVEAFDHSIRPSLEKTE